MQEKNHLRKRLKGNIVALGVGNSFKGDDGFGSELARRIKDKVNFTVYDCGTAPENYIGKVEKIKSDTVVIFDIAKSGNPFGTIKIFEIAQIPDSGLTTHDPSLKLFMSILKKTKDIDIFLLSVEPKQTEFGSVMSEEVSRSLKQLEDFFESHYRRDISK